MEALVTDGVKRAGEPCDSFENDKELARDPCLRREEPRLELFRLESPCDKAETIDFGRGLCPLACLR